ncbi:MAG TPA: diguanylate cyclase [bacterium]|nr:diguanylate cyclase [bacterium]
MTSFSKSQEVQKASQIRVLVVDDDHGVTSILQELFETAGYEVTIARSPREAVALAADQEFDLMMTDWNMPEMDGLQLTQKIKAAQPYCAVILMTGYGSQETVVNAFTNAHVDNYLTKPFSRKELLSMADLAIREQGLRRREENFYKDLEERVKRATAELAMKNKLLRDLSIRDDLTKLYNQRYFHKKIDQEVRRAYRQNHPLTLVLFDIDGFKLYNDTYGHQKGNEILRKVGEIVSRMVRRDIDSAFRYGGDEFVVILPETSEERALQVAERIRLACEKRASVTVSVGVRCYVREDTPDSLLRDTDQAMYSAKQKGGNSIQVLERQGLGK